MSADLRAQGNEALRAGDLERAVRLYTEAADVSRPTGGHPSVSDHATALLNRAMVLIKLGRHADARRDCEGVLAVEPGNAKALFRAVHAAWSMGDVAGATALVPRLHAAAGDDPAVVALIRSIRSGGREEAPSSAPTSATAARGGRPGQVTALRPGSCTVADVVRAAATYARAGGSADAAKALLLVVDAAVPAILSSPLPAGVITLSRRAGWSPVTHGDGAASRNALAGCASALPVLVHALAHHGAGGSAPVAAVTARHAIQLWLAKGLAAAATGGWAAEAEEAHGAGPVVVAATPIADGVHSLPAVASAGASALAGDLARAAQYALDAASAGGGPRTPSDLLQPSGAAIATAATTPLQHAFPLAVTALSASLVVLQRPLTDTTAHLLKSARPPPSTTSAALAARAPGALAEGDGADAAAAADKEARKGAWGLGGEGKGGEGGGWLAWTGERASPPCHHIVRSGQAGRGGGGGDVAGGAARHPAARVPRRPGGGLSACGHSSGVSAGQCCAG